MVLDNQSVKISHLPRDQKKAYIIFFVKNIFANYPPFSFIDFIAETIQMEYNIHMSI